MCGRLAQHRAAEKYLASLGVQATLFGRTPAEDIGRYNVAPHSRVDLLRRVGEGLVWSPERWGWSPSWAKAPVRSDINATREKVAHSTYFRQVWPNRALLCADGWYEWCPVEGQKTKQAYYIRRSDSEPLFIPAIGQFSSPETEPRTDDGFRIITADSAGGMLDIHDRRPIVFGAADARSWVSAIPSTEADHMLQTGTLPVESFTWYPVGRDVGNPRNEGCHPIKRVVPS
ncbi:SOS response-associated peptidase family protein [Stutzerimonas chloritidismutans]|uniref:SOS response-associated peptidase family protein n=1 Tax=Stutzerimonas chloritidismutans TaxID=203192 RepID=UPI003F140416